MYYLKKKKENFVLNYNKGNYEKTKLLFNQNFLKEIEICKDVNNRHGMLFEILHG